MSIRAGLLTPGRGHRLLRSKQVSPHSTLVPDPDPDQGCSLGSRPNTDCLHFFNQGFDHTFCDVEIMASVLKQQSYLVGGGLPLLAVSACE